MAERTCSVEGCPKRADKRGWCGAHYQKWRVYGDPLGQAEGRVPRLTGTPGERFWPKVDKNGPVPEYAPHLGPCWCWLAAENGAGYGIFRLDGRNVRAHRWAYEALVGPIPKGLQLDHLCRVRHCVNPAHLEPVTSRQNSERGLPGGRTWRKNITHCPSGHEYSPENTRVYYGSRVCLACRRERSRVAAQRAKERRRALRV